MEHVADITLTTRSIFPIRGKFDSFVEKRNKRALSYVILVETIKFDLYRFCCRIYEPCQTVLLPLACLCSSHPGFALGEQWTCQTVYLRWLAPASGWVRCVVDGMAGSGLSPDPAIPSTTHLTQPEAPQALRRVKSANSVLNKSWTTHISDNTAFAQKNLSAIQ